MIEWFKERWRSIKAGMDLEYVKSYAITMGISLLAIGLYVLIALIVSWFD